MSNGGNLGQISGGHQASTLLLKASFDLDNTSHLARHTNELPDQTYPDDFPSRSDVPASHITRDDIVEAKAKLEDIRNSNNAAADIEKQWVELHARMQGWLEKPVPTREPTPQCGLTFSSVYATPVNERASLHMVLWYAGLLLKFISRSGGVMTPCTRLSCCDLQRFPQCFATPL